MDYKKVVAYIRDKTHNRSLLYFGTRFNDIEYHLDIFNSLTVFGLIGRGVDLSNCSSDSVCLEDIIGRRLNLDKFDIDLVENGNLLLDHKERLVNVLSCGKYMVFSYSSSNFLDSIMGMCGRKFEHVYLGNKSDISFKFNNKRYVESLLSQYGIKDYIQHSYFTIYNMDDLYDYFLLYGKLVVMPICGSGGNSVKIISTYDSVQQYVYEMSNSFSENNVVAASSYRDGFNSYNVGACVFKNGNVSFHGLSLQLIGIDGVTEESLGYCGNDFVYAAEHLDRNIVDKVEDITIKIGKMLSSNGYYGAYGIDFLINEFSGEVLFTELNARFQGSSVISCMIDRSCNRSDIFLNHMLSHLGFEYTNTESLYDYMKSVCDYGLSHLILHSYSGMKFSDLKSSSIISKRTILPEKVKGDDNSIYCQYVFNDSISESSYRLKNEIK